MVPLELSETVHFQIVTWTIAWYERNKRKFWEGNMNSKRVWVLLLTVAFALTITVSLASADYVVIKDKNGRCSVRESDHKTPKTIAGPFKTKEEAQNAKEKECATAGTTKEKEPGVLDKAKQEAKEKADKAKQEAKEKADKAKQALKEKAEKAKQEAKEKEEKAKDKK
jgi:cell division protein FtsN